MAKLEKDLSGLVGKSVVFIRPYETVCTMQVSYSTTYPDKAKIETMSAGFACSEVVINPGEKRIIGYFDKRTGLLYLLGNDVQPTGLFSKGFYVYLGRVTGSANAGATMNYKEQPQRETNVANADCISALGKNTEEYIGLVSVNDIPIEKPIGSDYWNYRLTYTEEQAGAKLPQYQSNLLTNNPNTTSFALPYGGTDEISVADFDGNWQDLNSNTYNTISIFSLKDYYKKLWTKCMGFRKSVPQGFSYTTKSSKYGNDKSYADSGNLIPLANAIPLNLIISSNLDACQKYLDDGTIPPDATAYVPTPGGEDDGNDTDENGVKKSQFDENEPSAPSVNSVKLSNLHNYWITESQMQSFYDAVWNTDLTDFVKGAFTGIYSNLISNVVSLKYMPTSPTNLGGTGDTSPVILGFKTYDELTVQTIGNEVAPIVDIGSYQFKREYNSFADYAPYTDIRLYLPFVGVVPLDTNLFMGTGGDTPPKLNVKAQYDLQSGLITYFIMRNKTMISSVSGRMAVEVPISLQSGLDTFTTISSNFIGKATSFAGNAMSGNPIGMVADIAQGSATAPPQTVFSSMGGDGAFYAHPKCMIMIRHPQYNRPKNYSHVVGFPAYVTKKVSDLSGFNTIKNPVIPLSDGMTSVERDMIVADMQKGLYY